MKQTLRARMKGYIQPFERRLALDELRSLAGNTPVPIDATADTAVEYRVDSVESASVLAARLAYWETVTSPSESLVTLQSLRESTVNLVRNGIDLNTLRAQLPFANAVPLPNRRCLRYGTHGVHEYRGKFFPQLVRSLINIAGVAPGATVGDPMSGSGTTVVEALLAGCIGRGIDMNPLSVFLGRAKSSLLFANPRHVVRDYEALRSRLSAPLPESAQGFAYLHQLPDTDQRYLRDWFAEDVLLGLDDISQAIGELSDRHSVVMARLALSNIIRRVSWQKDDDLRIRKEIRLDVEIDPKKEFLEELSRSVRAVLSFLYQNADVPKCQFDIAEGDARRCGTIWGAESIDLIVTSPPYATALPYLDTDRLSLCYLNLLPRPEHRQRDQWMIGNREVTEGQRKQQWAHYQTNRDQLPGSVRGLIDRVHSLNAGTDVGFRRRNLPALLAKYFFDMRDVLLGIHTALKAGGMAFVVVGNNHTIAGGQRVDIETARLLQDIGESVGLLAGESLPMDMLVSRDIFRKNAMASEEILAFRKGGHH